MLYLDLLDTHLLSRFPRALSIAPWLATNSLVRAVDAFSQCITAARRLVRQSLRLIQQCFTLRNKGLSLGITEGLAIKLGTLQQPNHLSSERITLCSKRLDLSLNSVGPGLWSGQSGKELVSAGPFLHPERER